MNTETNWTEVVSQLRVKTEQRKLEWQEGRFPTTVQDVVASALLRRNQARTFTAKVGEASYELSAGDSFGRGPYELKIWETRAGERHAVTALNSKLSSFSISRLTDALERLYRTVDSIVEREEEIATRLLGDLENL